MHDNPVVVHRKRERGRGGEGERELTHYELSVIATVFIIVALSSAPL